jgi:hypothetical protein
MDISSPARPAFVLFCVNNIEDEWARAIRPLVLGPFEVLVHLEDLNFGLPFPPKEESLADSRLMIPGRALQRASGTTKHNIHPCQFALKATLISI